MVQQDFQKAERVQVDVSVSKYKLTILYLKYITVFIALLDIIHTVFSFFNISVFGLQIICGISIVTVIFLYLTSYTFGFCKYHRIPIHYVVISNIISWIDYYIGIPITDKQLLCLYLIIFGIFSIWYVIDYKKSTCKHHR